MVNYITILESGLHNLALKVKSSHDSWFIGRELNVQYGQIIVNGQLYPNTGIEATQLSLKGQI